MRRVPVWPVCNCTLGACSIRESASSTYALVFSREAGVFSFSWSGVGVGSESGFRVRVRVRVRNGVGVRVRVGVG